MSNLIVFTCPNCSGFAKFGAEKCVYCGAPFHWVADKLDVPKMKGVAEKAWSPPVVDTIPSTYKPPPPVKIADIPVKEKRVGEWDAKLRIAIGDDGGNHYIVDSVTIFNKDYTRVEGRILINALSPALVYADWLMMSNNYFNIEAVDSSGIKVECRNCKFTRSDFMYDVRGGTREMSFNGIVEISSKMMEVEA